MSIFLLVNPAAGRGRAAGFIPAARAALQRLGVVTMLTTTSRGDETRCTRDALNRGATTIVALGGDGTVSQIACELVRAKSDVPLAIFGAGTGNDFAKSLKLPVHDFGAIAARIEARTIQTLDAARVDDDVFINIAGFGFDAEVLARTMKPTLLRGNALYAITALGQLFTYPGFRATINGEQRAKRWLTLIFANGAYFGAGFHIAPGANLTDGCLDGVFIGDGSPLRRGIVFGRATRGNHIGQAEVATERRTQFVLKFDANPLYQADGELRQAQNPHVVVENLPAAFRVIA